MLTRDDILALYEQGPEAVVTAILAQQATFFQRLEDQSKKIAHLEERLGLDSHNSSKPPSSDQPGSSSSRAQRRGEKKEKKRKPGGQPGHPGSTLKRVETPDHIVTHRPAACDSCGTSLKEAKITSVETKGRQVFDIPPVKIEVTEHRRARCRCGCGHVTRAEYPLDVRAPVQYGPLILSQALLLNLGHHVPLARTRDILIDLCGQSPSEAVLLAALERLGKEVEPACEAIADILLETPQLHADESGADVAGLLFWVHVISSPEAVLLTIDTHRGREAIERIGILPRYRAGQLMHDFWSSYQHLPVDSHGYCVAHLLRELTRLSERCNGTSHRWTLELADVLGRAVHARNEAVTATLPSVPENQTRYLLRRYRYWLTRGERLFEDAGSGSKERNLLRRLRRHEQSILSFLFDVSLEPTNNRAERDIRMVKLHDKISGCFRSEEAAQIWMKCRSYIQTARKQGTTFLSAIESALRGAPFMPVAMR